MKAQQQYNTQKLGVYSLCRCLVSCGLSLVLRLSRTHSSRYLNRRTARDLLLRASVLVELKRRIWFVRLGSLGTLRAPALS